MKKQLFQQFVEFSSRVYSLKFTLHGIRNEEDEFIHLSMKHVSIFDEMNVCQVFHCDGLLLCITKEEDCSRVMVWNPYLGQTRWIKPVTEFYKQDWFVLGLDNKNNHKIFRLYLGRRVDVYDFISDSWRVLDISPDSEELCFHNRVSLKGNAYFFDQQVTRVGRREVIDIVDYLVCFDFETERFGPRLPLPFNPPYPSFQALTLSSVRDDKLSVMYQHEATFDVMEIWISTKIEPNEVSWSKFLCVDTSLINGLPNDSEAMSFFVDEEKKIIVVFNLDPYKSPIKTRAYIIGEDGYFKSVNIEEGRNRSDYGLHVCSSYVKSSATISGQR